MTLHVEHANMLNHNNRKPNSNPNPNHEKNTMNLNPNRNLTIKNRVKKNTECITLKYSYDNKYTRRERP